MDIVNDATRNSSLFENQNLVLSNGKESSSPPHLPTVEPINLKYVPPEWRKVFKAKRTPRPPKEKKQLDVLSNVDKFSLRLIFMSEHMFTRQKSGVIVNRLKGKISAEEYGTAVITLDNYKSQFISELNGIILQHNQEIVSGFITMKVVDEVLDIFKRISLKDKNINQQNKLKQKIIANLAASDIHLANNDPLDSLRKSLMSLTSDQRSKVLSMIPLTISANDYVTALSDMPL
jgi:hypothetical protein